MAVAQFYVKLLHTILTCFFDEQAVQCGTTIAKFGRAIGVATNLASRTHLSMALTVGPTPLVVVAVGTGDGVAEGNPVPVLSSSPSLHNSTSLRPSQGSAAAGVHFSKGLSGCRVPLSSLSQFSAAAVNSCVTRALGGGACRARTYIKIITSLFQCGRFTAECFVCIVSFDSCRANALKIWHVALGGSMQSAHIYKNILLQSFNARAPLLRASFA